MKQKKKLILPLLCICSVIAVTYIVLHLPPHEKWCDNCRYEKRVRIVCTDAPEGTEALDILVPKRKLGTHFCERSSAYMDYPQDSEINRYSEDGYVSFTLHDGRAETAFSKAFREDGMLKACLQHTYGRFSQHYFEQIGDYKIAYVDKTGRILGVTDQVKVQRTLNEWQQTVFTADGSAASCIVYSHRAYTAVAALTVSAVHGLLIGYLIHAKRKRKTAGAEENTE